MNNEKKGNRLLIENPYIGPVNSSESGTEMVASCFVTKNNKPLVEFNVVIRINDGEAEVFKTDKYGFVSKRFVTRDDVVKATFIINDAGKIIRKESKPYPIRERKTTDKTASSFYYIIEPATTSKIINTLKIVDDFTADTDEAWKKFSDWLEPKSAYEKTWLLQTISKVKPEDIGRFMEQFIYYAEKNADKTAEMNRFARNIGLLPIMDIFLSFNQRMDFLRKKDKATYEAIITLLQKYNGDKINNFQFHVSHLNKDYFVTVMKNIADSKDPDQTATIRGFFNKPSSK